MRNYLIDLLHIDTGLPSRREAFGKQLCTALSYAPEVMIKDTDLVVTTRIGTLQHGWFSAACEPTPGCVPGGEPSRGLSNAYVRFVEEGQGLPSLWTNLQQQIYLGSEEFIERLQSRLPEEKEFSEAPKVQRRIICSLQLYKHQHSNPKMAMVKAYESGAYTLAQIAGHFGVHYSTVSRAVRQPE